MSGRHVAPLVRLASLLALVALFVPSPPLFSQPQDGATMTVLRGQVAVFHPDGSAVQPAPSGTIITAGDEIRTLAGAGASITFFGASDIELGQDTILGVGQANRQGDRVNISLRQAQGATIHHVTSLARADSSYRIDAGGAEAQIRGTTFAMVGPVNTRTRDVAALVCLDDCDARSTFTGCPLAPYMGYFVAVSKEGVESDCQAFPVARKAGFYEAGSEAVTTAEQFFQDPTDKPLENPLATARNEVERRDRRDEVPPPAVGGTATPTTTPPTGASGDRPPPTITPTITPTSLPVCDLGPTSTNGVVYTALPRDALRCRGIPSMGFEANSLVELGDHVGLASTSGTLTSLTVLFASFGCGVSGGAFSNDCVTNPGNATFTHPITAKIYAVNTSSGTPQPGALLATVTQTQTIPFRPSADRVNCTGAQAGKWFSPATGACQNAITQLLTFTFPAGTPLPSQVIWTVAFNTTHFGPSPIGPAPCNSSPSGCGYDSLNVGVFSFTGAPYIGTDVDPNGVFLNATNVLRNVAESTASGGIYCDGGPGGTLRLATPCWDGLRPLGEIKLN